MVRVWLKTPIFLNKLEDLEERRSVLTGQSTSLKLMGDIAVGVLKPESCVKSCGKIPSRKYWRILASSINRGLYEKSNVPQQEIVPVEPVAVLSVLLRLFAGFWSKECQQSLHAAFGENIN